MSDRPIADKIYTALQSEGIPCWMDYRNIAAGLLWPDEISKAVSQSNVMIVVLSANTQKSKNVSNEVSLAASEDKIIIPFFVEKVVLEGGSNYYWGIVMKFMHILAHWSSILIF